jgi:hypothetical protein
MVIALRLSDLPPARHIRADPLEPSNYYDQEATVEQELPASRYAVLCFAVHEHCVYIFESQKGRTLSLLLLSRTDACTASAPGSHCLAVKLLAEHFKF